MTKLIQFIIKTLVEEGLVKLTPYYTSVDIKTEELPKVVISKLKKYFGKTLSRFLFDSNKESIGRLEGLSLRVFNNKVDEERFFFILRQSYRSYDMFYSYA